MRRCAICYNDPAIAHWKNPNPKRVQPRGTVDSSWACERCLGKKQNRGWRNIPDEEVYGVDIEHATEFVQPTGGDDGPYETAACIDIMKRYCMGESQRAIAAATKINRSFIIRTISHWKANYGHFVNMLKESLTKNGKTIQ